MIVLLARTREAEVLPALKAVDQVRVMRYAGPPARTPRWPSPTWADAQLDRFSDLMSRKGVTSVVVEDARGVPFAARIAARYPGLPVILGQERAVSLLTASSEPAGDVVAPAWLADRTVRPPLIVQLVDNSIDGDSRVQKVARSLASLGYDSILIGKAPSTAPDGGLMVMGSALALRVPMSMDALAAQSIADADESTVERLRADLRAGRIDPADAYPAIADFAVAVVPLVVSLRPSAIHVHDPALASTALESVDRLREMGDDPRLVVDVHEWTEAIERRHPLQASALAVAERRLIARSDAVITVSDVIADGLVEGHALTSRPAVVTNSPRSDVPASNRDLRSDLGLGSSVPLVVYVGVLLEGRGVATAVEALPLVDGLHLACVSKQGPGFAALRSRAEELGVSDRLHRVDYVPADDVPSYIASADIGLVPFLAGRNGDFGVPTKLREYLHARLPVLATDAGLSGRMIAQTGIGELARPGDARDLANALSRMLQRLDAYRARITDELVAENSWESQERTIAEVYSALLPPPVPPPPTEGVLVAPANSAGQAWAWSRALQRRGVPAAVLEARAPGNPFGFPADRVIARGALVDVDDSTQFILREVLPHRAIVLESALALGDPLRLGDRARSWMTLAEALAGSGRPVALLFHGSDVRRPDAHASRRADSPFADPAHRDLTSALRTITSSVHRELASWFGPILVPTPDLLREHPAAQWLPLVVDLDEFYPPASRDMARRPVVLHLPSSQALKGTRHIDPVLLRLHDAGLIDYRSPDRVPHAQVPVLMRDADIVVDQVGMGILGVGALEAMASGVVVVTDPGEEVIDAYGEDPPLVRVTGSSLEPVLRDLVADVARRAQLSQAAPEFVHRFHDGGRSAEVLIEALGLQP